MNQAPHMTIDLPATTDLEAVKRWTTANAIDHDRTSHSVRGQLKGWRYRFNTIEEKMNFGMRWL
ncbi:hypothetical protein [Sphingomonas sp. CFBP 13706]|uniref:hypothetical protein n=1 Tax=Sphingomonas sp. CFBP 13706 TaxID=2775314 RepID=UPI001A7EA5F6|nr:hypothetical protein [Sphingomonas sp. CFBP 13706]